MGLRSTTRSRALSGGVACSATNRSSVDRTEKRLVSIGRTSCSRARARRQARTSSSAVSAALP
eukprot:scaffold20725_cov111-Isochrysis_galbana.AAC.3